MRDPITAVCAKISLSLFTFFHSQSSNFGAIQSKKLIIWVSHSFLNYRGKFNWKINGAFGIFLKIFSNCGHYFFNYQMRALNCAMPQMQLKIVFIFIFLKWFSIGKFIYFSCLKHLQYAKNEYVVDFKFLFTFCVANLINVLAQYKMRSAQLLCLNLADASFYLLLVLSPSCT